MVNIRVDESVFIEMLVDRVKYWTDDSTTIELYRQKYENYVYGGCFECCECSVDEIVDNDYINYCDVICEGDENYKEIKRVYDEQGLGDCSCETDCYSYIEAVVNDNEFLVRY